MRMAERKGFEPSRQLSTAYSLSRGAPSTTRPPLHAPADIRAGRKRGNLFPRGMLKESDPAASGVVVLCEDAHSRTRNGRQRIIFQKRREVIETEADLLIEVVL